MKNDRGDSGDDGVKTTISGTIRSSIGMLLLIGAGLALFVYAGYMFATQFRDYQKASRLYEDTIRECVSSNGDAEAEDPAVNWEDLVDVDLAKLRTVNEDIIGWIHFENVDISYPVLYSGDDAKYLRKTYTGETASAGSIFMEGENNRDFSDVHTILYGHNMKDLSMFGRLKYYVKDREYIKDHAYFQIITEHAKYRYKIFAYKVVSEDADIYTVYRTGGPDFKAFVEDVVRRGSYSDAEENIQENDRLITLSTCTKEDRLVVTAVRCGESPYECVSE